MYEYGYGTHLTADNWIYRIHSSTFNRDGDSKLQRIFLVVIIQVTQFNDTFWETQSRHLFIPIETRQWFDLPTCSFLLSIQWELRCSDVIHTNHLPMTQSRRTYPDVAHIDNLYLFQTAACQRRRMIRACQSGGSGQLPKSEPRFTLNLSLLFRFLATLAIQVLKAVVFVRAPCSLSTSTNGSLWLFATRLWIFILAQDEYRKATSNYPKLANVSEAGRWYPLMDVAVHSEIATHRCLDHSGHTAIAAFLSDVWGTSSIPKESWFSSSRDSSGSQ